jgi:hypothetical protein
VPIQTDVQVKLRTLDVGNNMITVIENISHLTELEEFWVSTKLGVLRSRPPDIPHVSPRFPLTHRHPTTRSRTCAPSTLSSAPSPTSRRSTSRVTRVRPTTARGTGARSCSPSPRSNRLTPRECLQMLRS